MSQLAELENEIVALIGGIQVGGQGVFAVVRGTSVSDRSGLVGALRRERKPVALVALEARPSIAGESTLPGSPRFVVAFADQSLRSQGEARLGGTGVSGVFGLSERLSVALTDASLATDFRLLFADESILVADDRTVAVRQRYDAHRQSESVAPTFNGQAIAGSSSVVRVRINSAAREIVTFGFPGIDGVFRHDLGDRGRTIQWRGQLRAANDAALNTIESTLESLVADPRPSDMVDSWGRTHKDCVLDDFNRLGPRQRASLSGQALQDFELTFRQLLV